MMKNLIEMEVCQSFENNSTSKAKAGKIFNPFFEQITDVVFKKIAQDECVLQHLQNPVKEILDRNILIEKMFYVSKRVLIADMNIRREKGDLSGNSEEEEYEDYVFNYLMNPNYLKQLFREYPIWRESLFQVVDFFVRNIIEIIQHLYSDQGDLNAEFFCNNNFDQIRRIEGSGSDTHCENRIVYRVILDNGEILYHKSRVNTGVRFFYELYEKMCESVGISSYVIPVWTGEGYVWEREAVYSECVDEQQVRNYFVRLGFVLSICHLCHSGDMHYENMLACGEYPLIIDFETLVQMMPNSTAIEEKAGSLLIGRSVLPIGILPFYGTPGKAFNADFSGLCGGGKQVMDLKIPMIENPGKSTMSIVYRYGETREKNNRLRLNGQLIQAENYIKELQRGFESGYIYILEHKKDIEDMMQCMEGSVFRQLFRNTQEYHMILDLSYHPEFMKQPGDRYAFLKNALETPLFEDKQFILKQEIEDLLTGDIPYFQFDMSTGEIQNCHGKPLQKYFEKTGMDILKEQLENRSFEDMRFQKHLIEISLRYSQVEHFGKLYENVDEAEADDHTIVDMCSKIADIIYEHHVQINDHVLWLNTRIMSTGVDQRRTYFSDACDRYLYEGTMGIAVFMAAFLKMCPKHKISELYSKVINELFMYTDLESKDKERTTGVFLGESSMVYGYQLLYQITNDKLFLDYAKKHCMYVEKCLENDLQYDLLGGNAGAILAFLNMYDIEKDVCYLDMAMKAGDYVIQHAVSTEYGIGWKNLSNDELLGGFAHGCAGIMYALARLAFYTSQEKYLDAAYQAFSYEKTMYQPELGGWRDYRAPIPYYISDFKWCHGTAGIVLGWSHAADYFDEKRKNMIYDEIAYVLENNSDMHIKEELCLCHGNMGNVMIGQLTKIDSWKKSAEQNQKKSIQVIGKILTEMEDHVILHEQYDYSLMTGWAGIGYVLLRNLPIELPGILAVEWKHS